MNKLVRTARIAAIMLPAIVSGAALAQNKSNVQRERCAHLGERAVNSQSRKDADTASVVGALVVGGIIGAVVVNNMNEKAAREAATNKCLAGAGLLPKGPAPTARSGNRRTDVGAGPAWARRSIRSQQ
jgi:hypothetical protein